MKTVYTTTDVAQILQLTTDAVRARIASGELRAIDVATPGSVRPRYRVTEEQLRDYVDSRKTSPLPKRKRQVVVQDYFAESE